MLGIPEKLFQRATALGFDCRSDQQQHLIQPTEQVIGSTLDWHLAYLKGYWVLVVKDIPQMHFGYNEVIKFLDRFEAAEAGKPLVKSSQVVGP